MSEAAGETIANLVEITPVSESRVADRKAQARAAILNGPIMATLTRLALPTIAVLLAQTAVGVAETYYVGYLGTDALAGVALVFPVYMLMITMSNGGLGSGVASSVARAIGARRQHDADALVLHAIVLAAVVGAAFTVGLLWGGPALYAALGGNGASLTAALAYSDTVFGGAVAIWIVNLVAAALRGSGNVKIPALVTLVGALVMIPASPALIFGFGPIPRLGVAGAGLAFVLYYACALVVLLRYMNSGRSGLKLRWVRLEWRLFADILKVGIPTALNTVQTNLTVILVTGAVGRFGVDAIAGYGIASRLDYVMIPILFGLSSAVLTMVGIAMGAGQTARARKMAWVGTYIGAGFAEIVGLGIALAPALWAGMFTTQAAVSDFATTYLAIVAPTYGFMATGFVFAFAAQGAGHAFWPFLAYTIRTLLAAGGGIVAVHVFHAGMTGLSMIVAASYVIFAPICGVAMLSKTVWQVRPPKIAS
ncbi:MATE family efflux transporter [Gluconacetobacter tumulicola]|uniref:MATE family efflux transporter n=1 Tax=Gluconacetobacter tumulicola TaxID=1017177 RepID=A0A7W4JFR4_9PROT|nr:MATE family efflux transporter [Gluconacetobacter tumulicola]MBB2180227.1 MATE family efflux transporter [Gluconacetobacter tumulicola]